jgi:hypothetical protein
MAGGRTRALATYWCVALPLGLRLGAWLYDLAARLG